MPSYRWIDLAGAANVRDLGGLPLRRGGTTRRGVLVRADNLQGLTPRDVERLVGELGVRRVLDLRTGLEVSLEGPGPLSGDDRVEVLHRSLHPEEGERTDALHPSRDGDDEETPRVRAYLGYLADRPDSIASAVADLAAAGGAVVVHCAAGMDRTGVVCALVLEAVGVEREAIVADYVATGERMEAIVARLLASDTYAADVAGRDWTADLPLAETLERVLAIVDERDGGAEAWLRAAGVPPSVLARLRDRLATG